MSLAEATREAARERPFLVDALRAGVLNHAAAAAYLGFEDDRGAVATALRRFGDDLRAADGDETEAGDAHDRSTRVTMQGGVGLVTADEGGNGGDGDGGGEPLLVVGGTTLRDGGSGTAVLATGDVDARALESALGRLRVADVAVRAAAVADGSLLVAVDRRAGARAVRLVEAALAAGSE
jgi:hypothetical protein